MLTQIAIEHEGEMASLADGRKLKGMLVRTKDRAQESMRREVLLEVAYKLHVKEVYGLAFRLLASQSAAEDATASAYGRFSREIPRRWNEKLVLKRLRELVISEALETLRPRISRGFDTHATLADSPSPESMVGLTARSLHSTKLEALIQLLPDTLRVALVLRDIEGFDTRTIAQLLRTDEEMARILIRRARVQLRQIWRSG